MHQYLIICVWRICIESISLLYIELAICSIIILFPQKEVSLHQSTFFKEKKKKLFIFNSVAFCIKVVWFLISKNMLKPKTLKNVKYLWNSIPSAYFLKLFLIPAIFLTYSLTTRTLNPKSFFLFTYMRHLMYCSLKTMFRSTQMTFNWYIYKKV